MDSARDHAAAGPAVLGVVIAAVAVGTGIAGVILRRPTLGWDTPSTEDAPTSRPSRPTMRAILGGVYAAAGAGPVVVLA